MADHFKEIKKPFISPVQLNSIITVPGVNDVLVLADSYAYSNFPYYEITYPDNTTSDKIYGDLTGAMPSTQLTLSQSGIYTIHYHARTAKIIGSDAETNDFYYRITVIENRLPLKKWTIKDVINRTLDIAEPLHKGETPRFRLNEEQAALFDNIIAPQFSFTKQTLRECMQEVGKFIHGEPRLKVKKDGNGYYYEVYFDMYGGTKKAFIATRTYESKTTSHAVESFASSLDSNAENLINTLDKYSGVITEPFSGGYKTVRTETQYSRITDENMIIATQYPIYSVEKLEWIREIPIPGQPSQIAYDITPYLFEASVYNTQLSSYDGQYPYSRAYGLRYKQGEKNIDALNFKQDSAILPAYKNYSIVNIVRKVTGNDNFTITNYPALAFRVTYTPIYNARVSQSRVYYKDAPKASALIFNQQSNLVESRYYGENLKGAIARIGNIEQTITYKLARLSYVPKAGQMFDDDYYIAAVSVEFLPTFIKCTIGLSKDFNRLSQYIGINSEKRYSEVSQTQAIERNVLYREYIVIGDYEEPDDIGTVTGQEMIRAIADTFTQSGSYKPLTNVVAWGTSYQGNELPVVSLPVVSSAFGNSISFSWKYEDNYSAGATSTYRENGTGSSKVSGYFQNDYRYTDYYGRMYYYNFDLQADGKQTDGFMLPAGVKPSVSSGYISTVEWETPYILRKDSREVLQVNFQIDFVTNRSDMIIGSALASYCGAVRGSDSSLKAKLYVFPERLNKFIDHVEGSVSVDLKMIPSAEITIGIPSFGKSFFISLEKTIFPASGKSWAIVTAQTELPPEQVEDEEGNEFTQTEIMGGDVLLAQNIDVEEGQPLSTIYFTLKREIYDKSVWKDKR